MIVKMKKTAVFCVAAEKSQTLERLRELGILHVKIEKKQDSHDRAALENLLSGLTRAAGILRSRKKNAGAAPPASLPDVSNAGDIAKRTLEITDRISEIGKDLFVFNGIFEKLLPWGDFSPDLMQNLKSAGIHIYLCAGDRGDLEKIPAEAAVKIINRKKNELYFAVFSKEALDTSTLPTVKIPENFSLSKVKKIIADRKTEMLENEARLDHLAKSLPELLEYQAEISEELEFVINRDGMEGKGELAYIQGYMPVAAIEKLRKSAAKFKWGLLISDPRCDDPDIPTLIIVPKIFKIVRPIFEFIGLSPGYREWDVSVCFLFFFTIFFGIIVGDAGYGLLFLFASIFAKFRLKEEKFRLPINLSIVLSLSTIVWGILSGVFFAIPSRHLPQFMRGIDPLTNPETKDANFQLVCFVIAASHLSLARVWKAILAINSTKCLGELGWALLIWGNFFTIVQLMVKLWPFPAYLVASLYSIGLLLICLFGINWKDIGEALNFPFNLIGSLGDVLSYIRLFALGMATYCIADSFNSMSVQALNIPFVGVIVMIFALFVGHTLNIIMSLIGVLVHAIRLNTLEFSNHMGLQWSGTEYRPFKKNNNPQYK
jgi:V/A-type H+-transporting ATPase subunit I